MRYYFYRADVKPDTPHTVEIEDLEEAITRFRECAAAGESYGSLEFMQGAGEDS